MSRTVLISTTGVSPIRYSSSISHRSHIDIVMCESLTDPGLSYRDLPDRYLPVKQCSSTISKEAHTTQMCTLRTVSSSRLLYEKLAAKFECSRHSVIFVIVTE